MAAQRKVMLSFRLHPGVAAEVDARAAAAGQSRTDWLSATVARAVLASGHPHPVRDAVDDTTP